MKSFIKKSTKVLIVSFMSLMIFGINNNVYAKPAGEKPAIDVKYYVGDTIRLTEDTWISFNDHESKKEIGLAKSGLYDLPDADFYDLNDGYAWGFGGFVDMVNFSNSWGFYFYKNITNSIDRPIGIKCIAGDGTQTNPFEFELIFDNVIKEVEVSIVSPRPGDVVSFEEGNWASQTPRPEVIIPSNSKYHLDTTHITWLFEDLSTFSGTFIENEYYYFGVTLDVNPGYSFLNEYGLPADLKLSNCELFRTYTFNRSRVTLILKTKCKAPTNSIEVGNKYALGKEMELNEPVWIAFDDTNTPIIDIGSNGEYIVSEPNFVKSTRCWTFEGFIPSNYHDFNFYTGITDITKKPTGIKCIGGEGTFTNPFKFELSYDTFSSNEINKIEFTITPPRPGDTTELKTPGNLNTQTNSPVIFIPDEVNYYLFGGEGFSFLYAYWVKEDNYNVAFEGTFEAEKEYYLKVYVSPKTSYEFVQPLEVEVEGGEFVQEDFFAPYDETSLILKTKCLKEHKVSFILNGGTMKETETSVVDGDYLDLSLFQPTREGQYWFSGWHTDEECENYFEYWNSPINSDLKLYAKWEKYAIVKYVFNGGNLGGEKETILHYPIERGLKEYVPTYEEMEVMWGYEAPKDKQYVGIKINGIQYKPKDELIITGNITIETINLPKGDILTFDLDGGELGDQKGVAFFSYKNDSEIKLPEPTKQGYELDYWQGSKYYAGDTYKVNGNHDFKAIWKVKSPITPPTPITPKPLVPNTGVK